MKRALVALGVLGALGLGSLGLGSLGAASADQPGPDQRPALTTRAWKITEYRVGPLKSSMTASQAIATGFFKSDPAGCAVAPRGVLRNALDTWFDPGTKKFMKVYVNRASVADAKYRYTFKTAGGTHVGSTVRDLKAAEHPVGPTNHIYEHGFTYYVGAPGHWMTFVIKTAAESKADIKPTDTVESIIVSKKRILGGGGC